MQPGNEAVLQHSMELPQLATCNKWLLLLLKDNPLVCIPVDHTAVYTLAFITGLGVIKMCSSISSDGPT